MFKFDDDTCYRMPAHFGGFTYDPLQALHYHDSVCLNYTYATDGARLADYLPEGFELMRPELNVSYSQNREIDWMAGSAYNLVQVAAQARFHGRRDRVEGQFVLVIWENRTDPILGGREETGMPKIHADIQDLHKIQGTCFTNASFEGNTFLRLEMSAARELGGAQFEQVRALAAEMRPFGWRYIPKVGGPGAEVSQPILYPQGFVVESAWTGGGALEWIPLRPEQNPMQWHIIRALAELPILEMSPVVMSAGTLVLKPAQARVLQ